MSVLEELKKEYNYNLQRYYNGIKYCEEHIDEIDIWIPELEKIMDKLGKLLADIKQYQKVSMDEEFGGFKIWKT